MARDNDDSLEKIDCQAIASASDSRVVMSTKVKKEYDSLDLQQRGRFKRIMERWCLNKSLTPKMMNRNEGRTNGQNLRLEAFKAFTIRLYGYETRINGIRSFVIVDLDPAKKQDKADPTRLERAKKRVNLMNTKLKEIKND